MTLNKRDQEILECYLARRARWEGQAVEPDQPESEPEFPRGSVSLDEQAWVEAGSVITQTQDQWIAKYNAAGRILAAAPDFYAAVKSGDESFIAGLREDCKNWLALSTRLQYQANSLEDTLIHYHDSTVTAPVATNLIIPVFRGAPIEEALVTGSDAVQGLAYLQAYFGTQDSAQQIMQTLERVSGKPKDKIKVWTANTAGKYTRVSHPDRAAFVGFGSDDYFDVNGCGSLSGSGRSRGVGTGGAP